MSEAQVELGSRISPVDSSRQLLNRIRTGVPSPKRLATGAALGGSLLMAACGPVSPAELPPVQPIMGPRVPGMDIPQTSQESPTVASPSTFGETATSAQEAGITFPRVESRVFPARRADGTVEFTSPLRPGEREAIEQDVDTVVSTVRDLLHEDFLKGANVDLDQIAGKLKDLDDDSIVRWSARRSQDRIADHQEQVYLGLPDTSLYVGFVKDRNTGEIVYKSVNYSVDDKGNLLPDNSQESPLDQSESEMMANFLKLPAKLSSSIKPPLGSRPGFSPDKLIWEMPLFRSDQNPEDGLVTPLQIHTSRQYPFITSDNNDFEISLGGGINTNVNVELHQPGRGFALRGKGPSQP